MKSKFTYFVFSICVLHFINSYSQSCAIKQKVFSPGESINYEVYYHWGLIWANAGYANFKVESSTIFGNQGLHFIGTGATHKNYDWIYKVRDKFESWVDTGTLKPVRYIRDSKEGSNYTYNDNYFNYNKLTAKCYKIKEGKTTKDSLKIDECTFDVLTMIYYARCIDYSKYKPDTKIPISLYLDGKVYDKLYIRYVGKEKVKTELGEINCIKFKPLLIPGTIFSGGEEMTVWVSDDDKKIPVLIETPIVVGEIQVKIKK